MKNRAGREVQNLNGEMAYSSFYPQLITLFLMGVNVISSPVLYLSCYLKLNRIFPELHCHIM